MSFSGLILTNKGKEQLSEAVSGNPLAFTHIALGDGTYTGSCSAKKALENEVMRLPVQYVSRKEGTVVIQCDWTYKDAPKAFYFRELGIIGNGELCYYDNAGADAEWIDPENPNVSKQKRTRISLVIDSDVAVELSIPSGLYALAEDLIDFKDETGVALDGKANVNHGRHIPDVCTLISDWNNAVTNGWYMGNNAANGPIASWLFGLVIAHNSNYVYQEVYRFNIGTDAWANTKYIRAKTNGTWGSWINVTAKYDELKKSVSDGKSLLASTITNHGVQTAADAAFATISANIDIVASNNYKSGRLYGNAESMKGNAEAGHVLKDKTFTSEAAGVNQTGSIPTLSADTDSVDGVNTHHITDYLEISAFVVGDSRNYFCCRIPKNTYTGSTQYISTLAANFGDATAANVLSGKKFTSEAGLKVSGSMRNYSGVDIPRIGDTANIQDVTTGQWSNSVGAGSTLRFKPDFAGYVDTDTTIGMQCYGLHPSVVKTGALIGGNGSPAKGALRGTYDKESANPITASAVLNGKIGFVNGAKVTGSMPDKGAVSASVGIGGSYTIPKGYHNGSGKVSGPNPKKLKFMVGFGIFLTVPNDQNYLIQENYSTDYMKHANNEFGVNVVGSTGDCSASVHTIGTINVEGTKDSSSAAYCADKKFTLPAGEYIMKMRIRNNRVNSGSSYNIGLAKYGEYPLPFTHSTGKKIGTKDTITPYVVKFTVSTPTDYILGFEVNGNTSYSIYCLDIWKVE